MNHEKIFKREDGTKVKIIARLIESRYACAFVWDFDVEFCAPKKRTWQRTYNTDDYRFRKLNMDERHEFVKAQHLKVATADEIIETQMELWEGLKPKLETFYFSPSKA